MTARDRPARRAPDSVGPRPYGSNMHSTDDEASNEELAALITAGAVRLAAATASWLRLVARFDERGGWHGVGIRSCAEWLAWQCGLLPNHHRRTVTG